MLKPKMMKRLFSIALLVSVILAGCNKKEVPPVTTPEVTFSLAVTLQGNNSEGFRFVKYNSDGTGGSLLINKTFPDNSLMAIPDLTAKGDKVVYASNDSIYVMNVSTQTSTFIYKHDNPLIVNPAISDDGSKVAFSAFPPSWVVGLDIYVVNAVPGAIPVNITNNMDGYYSADPVFSPDMSRIAYTRNLEDDYGMYVSDISGNNLIRISEVHNSGGTEDEHGVFSKDGTRLIYISNKYNPNSWGPGEIVVSGILEGAESTCTRLTSAGTGAYSGSASFPALSGDGKTVFFIGNAQGRSAIFKVPLSGGTSEVVAIIANDANNESIVGLSYLEK
jgi:Tol biopolymer transport system component